MEALEVSDGRTPKTTLTGLNVYPVKSARGIALGAWPVDELGLRYDRRWMVVDSGGEFITQRTEPRLALVAPVIRDGVLQIEAPGMTVLELPLEPTASVFTRVRVWDDTVDAAWLGEKPADWFSRYLECSCQLVYLPSHGGRAVNPVYAPPEATVSFADAFPFLVISEESLADLNRRLPQPLPMNRFRPNLVIAGAGYPYAEDRWKQMRIGDITFSLVKPCSRCVITTTDQSTAERGKEPLRTLSRYRKVNGKAMFGQNAVHDRPGELRVGATVFPAD